MRPQTHTLDTQQGNLFLPRIEEEIQSDHPLVELAEQLPWPSLEEHFYYGYAQSGRPGKRVRLMLGILFLQQLHNLSEERTIAAWCQEPHWQYFCGCAFFDPAPPMDRSALAHWRKKFGKETVEMVLQRMAKAGEALGLIAWQNADFVLRCRSGS
uniref:Transposase InsH N-terminal domain-containing protein n=1 Tax=Magnetococcus massalia (strain MO-1) TaxID=451514 RepID=A0A1S7LKS6_MAGMO|nr:conserved protein of unknown function [Candidatus Magnetococcus massalia]